MLCPSCQSENPEGKRYCAECGALLISASNDLHSLIERQIEKVISDRFKDQRLVEIETTQAIAARLSGWARLFGFFVGIPLVILLVILASFGIKTYTDFVSLVKSIEADIKPKLAEAQKVSDATLARAKTASKEVELLRLETEQAGENLSKTKEVAEELIASAKLLESELGQVTKVAKEVSALSTRVNKVEVAIRYLEHAFARPSSSVLVACSSDEGVLEHESGYSVFAHYLLEGLRTGSADVNDDGFILEDELAVYLESKVSAQSNYVGFRSTLSWGKHPGSNQGTFLFRTPSGGATDDDNRSVLRGWYKNSYALVVGIGKYANDRWRTYNGFRRAAEEVATMLRRKGFQVMELYDDRGTRLNVLEALEGMMSKAGEQDRVLLFFSGHGKTVKSEVSSVAYLIPYDGTDSTATYVSASRIADASMNTRAKHRLNVFDMCIGGTGLVMMR